MTTSESPLSVARDALNAAGVTARGLLTASSRAKTERKWLDGHGRINVLDEILRTVPTIASERFRGVDVKARMVVLGLTYDPKTDWPLTVLARCAASIDADYKDIELARKNRNRGLHWLQEAISEGATAQFRLVATAEVTGTLFNAISNELRTKHAMFGAWTVSIVDHETVTAHIFKEEMVTINVRGIDMMHIPEIDTWALKSEERELCMELISAMSRNRRTIVDSALAKVRPLSSGIVALRERLARKVE